MWLQNCMGEGDSMPNGPKDSGGMNVVYVNDIDVARLSCNTVWPV